MPRTRIAADHAPARHPGVDVRVGEPGQQHPARQVDDLGARPGERGHLRVRAHRDDPPARYGDGLRPGPRGVDQIGVPSVSTRSAGFPPPIASSSPSLPSITRPSIIAPAGRPGLPATNRPPSSTSPARMRATPTACQRAIRSCRAPAAEQRDDRVGAGGRGGDRDEPDLVTPGEEATPAASTSPTPTAQAIPRPAGSPQTGAAASPAAPAAPPSRQPGPPPRDQPAEFPRVPPEQEAAHSVTQGRSQPERRRRSPRPCCAPGFARLEASTTPATVSATPAAAAAVRRSPSTSTDRTTVTPA